MQICCFVFCQLNYSLLFLIDLFSLQIENIFMLSKGISHLILPVKKVVWFCLLFMLRRIWKGQNNYGELSRKEWLKFFMIPLLTVASMLLMFFCNSAEAKVQMAAVNTNHPVVDAVLNQKFHAARE